VTELSDSVYQEENADRLLERHFHATLSGIGLSDRELEKLSAAGALSYIGREARECICILLR